MRTHQFNIKDIEHIDSIGEFKVFWKDYCKGLKDQKVIRLNPIESYDGFHFQGQFSFHVDLIKNKAFHFTGMEEALGYKRTEWTVDEIMFSDFIHPDHLVHFYSMIRTVLEFDFAKYGIQKRSVLFKILLKNNKGEFKKYLISSIPTMVTEEGSYTGGFYRASLVHGMADSFNFGWDITGDEKLVHDFKIAMKKHMAILLTKRELQVLECLKEGLSSKMIADKLGIAKNTVDNFRSSLLKKSSAGNTAQLISVAQKNGWI